MVLLVKPKRKVAITMIVKSAPSVLQNGICLNSKRFLNFAAGYMYATVQNNHPR